MRNNSTVLLLILGLFAHATVRAQWTPQAAHIFGALFSIDAHRSVDAQTDWAGVNVFPWSSAPTLSAWITRTSDGGATWQYSQIPGAEGYVAWGITALDAQQAWVSLNYRANRAKSRIYHTKDGGATWQLQFEGIGAGFDLHFFDAQNGVMVRGNRFRHTSDGGDNWSVLDTFNTANNGVFLVATESFDAYGDTIWVPAADGKIAKSTDRGKTWQILSTAIAAAGVSANMLDFGDGQHGLAVAAYSSIIDPSSGFYPALPVPRLFSTTDGGLTWSEIDPDHLPLPADDISISAIGAVPGLPGTYLMVASYYDADFNYFSGVYQSDNQGNTWKLLTPNPSGYGLQSLELVSPNAGWGGIGGDQTPGAPHFYRWNTAIVGTMETAADHTPIQVMPNPATDHLTLGFPEGGMAPGTTAFIIDAQGHLLLRHPTGARTELDISSLPPGAYTALVQDARGKTLGVKRWIKGE